MNTAKKKNDRLVPSVTGLLKNWSRRAAMAETQPQLEDGAGIQMTERLINSEPTDENDSAHSQPQLDKGTFAIILTTNSFDSADKALLTPAFRALVFSFEAYTRCYLNSLIGLLFFIEFYNRRWNSPWIQNPSLL